MDPVPRYREFSLDEIQKQYAPRHVYDDGQNFVIKPHNRAEGPVRFAIPRVLPIDITGQLIDPTLAIPDKDQILSHEMNLICTDMIYVHLGHCTRISASRKNRPPVYQLLLDGYSSADTLRLEIHYQNLPAWGIHHNPLPAERLPGEVLLYDSQPLNGIHWVDFWLIKIDQRLHRVREYFAKYQANRLIQT